MDLFLLAQQTADPSFVDEVTTLVTDHSLKFLVGTLLLVGIGLALTLADGPRPGKDQGSKSDKSDTDNIGPRP